MSLMKRACVTQAQLRGLVGDYQDSDEDALAKGLEAFETINRVVEEHEDATSPRAPAAAPVEVSLHMVCNPFVTWKTPK